MTQLTRTEQYILENNVCLAYNITLMKATKSLITERNQRFLSSSESDMLN